MRQLAALAEDGLETLGEIALGGRVAIGDPSRLLGEEGALRPACAPGRWLVLGRAWEADPDQLSELVVVHEDALADFYSRYDGLHPAGEAELPRGRVALLDAREAGDPALLASLFEPDELPWVLAGGFVAGEGPGGPARVFVDAQPAQMVLIALGPVPLQRAGSPEHVVDDS